MNKTVSYCFAAAALLFLTGCATFRINMASGYGPHTPPIPPPSFPATQWVDVGHWQTFLVSKGFLIAGKYQPNTFDAATKAATMKFQRSAGKVVSYLLAPTGCVNYATYRKAVQEGMPSYKPIAAPNSCAIRRLELVAAARSQGVGVTATGDNFRDSYMHMGCANFSSSDKDVTDWQNFLYSNGFYTSSYTAGQFDSPTQKATVAFQQSCPVTGDPSGQVGPNGWSAANNYFTSTGGMGVSLVSSNGSGLPTVPKATGCP